MNTIWPHTVLRSFLVLALILQSLMPASLAIAEEAGYDVSSFICNPSNSTPSAKANAHIQDLLTALGMEDSSEPPAPPSEHCSNCVINFSAVLGDFQRYLTQTGFLTSDAVYFRSRGNHATLARGPPLGGRAPPQFL